MNTRFNIDGHAYALYRAFRGSQAGKVIKESRGYNEGMDYFLGSDCATVTVFLVAKDNVPLFIAEMESFIQTLAKTKILAEQAEELLELTEYFNFAILHKNIENASFDFFVTNFMFDWHPFANAVLTPLSESTGGKLQKLSSFVIAAGSAYGDASVRAYAQEYLVAKGLMSGEVDNDFDMDNYTYEEVVPVFNAPAEEVLAAFIRLYFQNIPLPSSAEDSIDVLFHQAIERL